MSLSEVGKFLAPFERILAVYAYSVSGTLIATASLGIDLTAVRMALVTAAPSAVAAVHQLLGTLAAVSSTPASVVNVPTVDAAPFVAPSAQDTVGA